MKEKLQQEMMDLEKAYKAKLLTTNEYCDARYALAQRIKNINK